MWGVFITVKPKTRNIIYVYILNIHYKYKLTTKN